MLRQLGLVSCGAAAVAVGNAISNRQNNWSSEGLPRFDEAKRLRGRVQPVFGIQIKAPQQRLQLLVLGLVQYFCSKAQHNEHSVN